MVSTTGNTADQIIESTVDKSQKKVFHFTFKYSKSSVSSNTVNGYLIINQNTWRLQLYVVSVCILM